MIHQYKHFLRIDEVANALSFFLAVIQDVPALSRDGLAARQPPKFTTICVSWFLNWRLQRVAISQKPRK